MLNTINKLKIGLLIVNRESYAYDKEELFLASRILRDIFNYSLNKLIEEKYIRVVTVLFKESNKSNITYVPTSKLRKEIEEIEKEIKRCSFHVKKYEWKKNT